MATNKRYPSVAIVRLVLWLIKSNVLTGANCLFAPTDITKTEDVEAALAQTKVILTCDVDELFLFVYGTYFLI